MSGPDFHITQSERALLLRLVDDVLAERAFFSLGEMTTITSWSTGDVNDLAVRLGNERSALSAEELRFVGDALYAWLVSARKGRIVASEEEVELAEGLDRRRRSAG